jgi:Polyketide cyclase / dehydrase and lipid transport
MIGSPPCTACAETQTAKPDRRTSLAVDVVTEIVIDRPAEVVAAYTADPANAPAWYDNITAATWETSPPLRTGSRIAFTAQFLGRRLTCTYEITDFTPGERLVMRSQ